MSNTSDKNILNLKSPSFDTSATPQMTPQLTPAINDILSIGQSSIEEEKKNY